MGTHGSFYWNELMTTDVEAAKAFYAETLGWVYESMAMETGTYWIAVDGETPLCGLMDMTGMLPPEVPSHWFAYIQVDDIDARMATVEAAGGTVVRDIFDVPKVGRIAIVQDASGAAVGLITPIPTD